MFSIPSPHSARESEENRDELSIGRKIEIRNDVKNSTTNFG